MSIEVRFIPQTYSYLTLVAVGGQWKLVITQLSHLRDMDQVRDYHIRT